MKNDTPGYIWIDGKKRLTLFWGHTPRAGEMITVNGVNYDVLYVHYTTNDSKPTPTEPNGYLISTYNAHLRRRER